MTTTPRVGAISVGCADPAAPTWFYHQVLDLNVRLARGQFVGLKGAAAPGPDASKADIFGLGNRGTAKAEPHLNISGSPVLVDHPFCIMGVVPQGTC